MIIFEMISLFLAYNYAKKRIEINGYSSKNIITFKYHLI